LQQTGRVNKALRVTMSSPREPVAERSFGEGYSLMRSYKMVWAGLLGVVVVGMAFVVGIVFYRSGYQRGQDDIRQAVKKEVGEEMTVEKAAQEQAGRRVTDIRGKRVGGEEVAWRPYDALDVFTSPPKVAKELFDRIHSGMTLRELTDLLGRGWIFALYSGCGIITWTCEDGRELQVWPTTYGSEEVIDAGPRQIGGTGGRGRMWMTKLVEYQELQDLAILPK
jgi:hypothetical protein